MNQFARPAARAQRARSKFIPLAALLSTTLIPVTLFATETGRVAAPLPAHTLAAPTTSITLSDTLLTAGETSVVTFAFSEAVFGFTNSDLIVENGTLGGLSSSDGGVTWTATLTPAAGISDATNVITLDNTGVTDSNGIAGSGTTQSPNYAIDTAGPTASIALSDTLLQNGETATVTIAFSEPVTGLTISDLTAPNGSLSGLVSSDGGLTWLVTLTPAVDVIDSSNVITLDLTRLTDATGNSGSGTVASPNYAVNTAVPPTATITLSDTALAAGETSLVTITFSKPVSGFTNSDLIVDNGTLGGVSSSDGGKTWTATLTPAAGMNDATNVITLDNSGVIDGNGTAGIGTTQSPNYAIDTVPPTANIALSDTLLQNGETATVTISFSEAITGLTTADLTVPNGSLSGLVSGDGGVTWSSTLTPAVDVIDASNIITFDLTGVADVAGNIGSGTAGSANYAVNTPVPPTATIALSDTALAAGETSLATITFSKPVFGFTTSDLTADNATISGLSSSDGGRTWTATLTPAAGINDTTNILTLDNTGVADANGTAGSGTTQSTNYTIDTQRPTATITLSDTLLQNGETATVTIAFSEPVTGLTTSNLAAPNGSLSGLVSNDGGLTWLVTLTPAVDVIDSSNIITLNLAAIADAAGNSGVGTADSPNYEVNTALPPTATIALSDAALSAGESSVVTITFSKPVTGFTTSDFTADNATLSGLSSNDGGRTWTTTLTPAAGIEDATNVLTLNNAGVADSNGTTGIGTTLSPNYAIDTRRPTATITLSATLLQNGETATVTVVFSEPVTGLTAADLTVPNGSLSGLVSTDGGVTWSSALTPAVDVIDASNVVQLDLTGVTDAAGNSGSGTADSPNYAVNTAVPPTATITLSDTALAAADTSLVTITFSKPVTAFTTSDLTADNATVSALSSNDGGRTWTATLTPAAGIEDATNVLTLNNSGVADANGTAGSGTTQSPNYAIDTLRPTATIALSDSDLTSGETSVVMIIFSERVSGLTSSDLSVDNGTLTTVNSTDGGLTWVATLTPLSGINDPSNLIVLDNSKVTDAAGNAGIGSTSSSNYRVSTEAVPTGIPTLSTWVQLLLAFVLSVAALRVLSNPGTSGGPA